MDELECTKDYVVPNPQCELAFLETFQDDITQNGRWKYSKQPEYKNQAWIQGSGFVKSTLECDKALVAKNPATRYGIATLFDRPVTNQESDLVIQYEVRFQKQMECGGAYIKLLRDGSLRSAEELRDDTPFVVMFGPDICGTMDRVHVIIPHFNPKSGKWSEHHLRGGPRPMNDTNTHLYTLILRHDDSVEILIDQINKFTGDLNTDFEPPFSTPAVVVACGRDA